jgi:bla regulator protein blaR1
MRASLILVATLTLPVFAGGQSPSPAAADQRPRFETASVKPNKSPDAGRNNRFSPGRFAYMNTPVEDYIYNAYRFPSERVLGMPDWARREKFDITATHDPQYAAFSLQQLAMLQRLLEERFSLQTHRETREMPVYELVNMRTDGFGPRLRAATLDCSPAATANRAPCGTRISTGLIEGRSVDWRMVVGQLPSQVGRTVIDKTGLRGSFELKFEWNPDPAVMRSPEAVASATAAAATPGERVNIFTALQEQLGVKLQSAQAPLEVLVIDKLERPTPD